MSARHRLPAVLLLVALTVGCTTPASSESPSNGTYATTALAITAMRAAAAMREAGDTRGAVDVREAGETVVATEAVAQNLPYSGPTDFSPRVVLTIGYGPAESRPGYRPYNEGDEVHPDGIAVSPDGRIFITDPEKDRIMVFELRSARYLGSLTRDGHLLVALAWHPRGVATIDWDANELVIFGEDGSILQTHALSPSLRHAVWGISVAAEGIRVCAELGECLVLRGSRTLEPVPPAEQEGTSIGEAHAAGRHMYEAWADGTRVVQREPDGRTVLDFSLGEDFAAIDVEGEAEDGSFYVTTTNGDATHAWCTVFDSAGARVARFEMEPGADIGEVYVASNGVVYQLWHDDTRIKVIAYGLE